MIRPVNDNTLNVLIVEDDEEDFDITRGLFAQAANGRFHLDWASDYDAGLAASVTGAHDVCLIDYELRGESGVELIREARRQGARMPMMLLTGYSGRTVDEEARQAGADDFIGKTSLTPELLERTVRYAIERAQTLARVRESETKYRLLFDANPIPTCVVDSETERFLAVNDAAVRQYGHSRDEFLALTLGAIRPIGGESHRVAPYDSIATGPPEMIPLVHRRKNGTLIDVEVWCEQIIFDGLSVLLLLARDVTESPHTVALRKSEERFRELAANVSAIFFVVDPSGNRLLYVSPAYETVFEQTSAYALATPKAWLERVHSDDRDRILQQVNDSPASEVEFRIVRGDGTVRWIRWQATAVRDERGVTSRIVGTGEDITDLRRAQRLAESTSKMEAVGRLAGGVAHDFNNLLTAIMGEAEFLTHELPEGDERHAGAVEIMASSRRAADLTRQLVAFSRQQVFDLRALDLNASVANMDKLLRRVLREDIELVIVADPNLGAVMADAGQVEQVLLNLVVNARDSMPSGGRLTIETANVEITDAITDHRDGLRPGSYATISVSDEGTGIDEAVKPHIFEPFFTTKKQNEGTGLGLATVYGIVKQMNGYILVDTDRPLGTSFKVYLPHSRVPVKPTAPVAAGQTSHRGSETILLVEDDEAVRAIAARALTGNGYTVLPARHGIEAIELCAAHTNTVHAVLTDVVMPRMTGPETMAAIRLIRPGLRALYMSGYADRAIPSQRLEKHDSFLQKPFTAGSLLAKLREVLDAT